MKSLRKKIFIGIFTGMIVVIVLAIVTVYLEVTSGARARLIETLHTQAEVFSSVTVLQKDGSISLPITGEMAAEFYDTSKDDHLFEYRDANGKTILASPSMKGFRMPVPATDNVIDAITPRSKQPMLVYRFPFHLKSPVTGEMEKFTLYIADIYKPVLDVKDHFVETLGVAVPAALILSLLLAWLISHLTIRSISQFARKVKELDSYNLPDPLTLDTLDYELLPLGRAINHYLEKLRERMVREKRLLADTSHELRTPLAIMRSEIDLLLRRKRTSEELLDGLQELNIELDEIQQLTENLLALYRIESNQSQLLKEQVEIDREVAEVVNRMRPILEAAGNSVTIDGGRLLAHTHGSTIRHILTQLLENAKKYAVGAQIQISWIKRNGKTEIRVDDAGPGIPPTDQEKVFDRLYRLDRDRHRLTPGSGLGLALVKLYATSIHAVVSCSTSPLGGARFTIVINDKYSGLHTRQMGS